METKTDKRMEYHEFDATINFDGSEVARMNTKLCRADEALADKLGRQFAAAPEMLALLERLKSHFDIGVDGEYVRVVMDEKRMIADVKSARALLAELKG